MIGPFFDPGWVADNLEGLLNKTWEHLVLTMLAVVIGFLVSFPLGVYAYRHRRSYGAIASVSGVLYTIPSLALFALLVPFTGLSPTTAEIGLVSYTLLILIRNVVAGLDGVPDDAKEAATGMGFTARQLLWRVELPLAVPVILAGVRIATVTTVGLVTVTAVIGQGGLGYYILQGLQRLYTTSVIAGAVLSVVLAIAADRLLLVTERRLTPWTRRRIPT
ncbi:MAG: ABC transporter permease [Actinomycetota bacterium]